jgi:hypothetical protein
LKACCLLDERGLRYPRWITFTTAFHRVPLRPMMFQTYPIWHRKMLRAPFMMVTSRGCWGRDDLESHLGEVLPNALGGRYVGVSKAFEAPRGFRAVQDDHVIVLGRYRC